MDHRGIIASLTPQQRRSLLQKSNIRGLISLAVHSTAILFFWLLIMLRVPFWPVLMVVQGVLVVFLFTLMHEAIHKTAFASDWLNILVAKVIGFLIILPAGWFKFFHFAHHRHTQDPARDPELASAKPETIWQYAVHVSGVPVWFSHVRTLVSNAFGLCRDEFVPQKSRDKVQREALLMLAGYLITAIAGLYWGWVNLLYVWVIPALLGQPFLRVYLLAEHGRCPFVANMLENTRTTFTNRLVRQLAWNMPYHAEHHAIPTVPFHKLPELHELTRDHLRVTEDGYIRFNRKYVATLNERNTTPY